MQTVPFLCPPKVLKLPRSDPTFPLNFPLALGVRRFGSKHLLIPKIRKYTKVLKWKLEV